MCKVSHCIRTYLANLEHDFLNLSVHIGGNWSKLVMSFHTYLLFFLIVSSRKEVGKRGFWERVSKLKKEYQSAFLSQQIKEKIDDL